MSTLDEVDITGLLRRVPAPIGVQVKSMVRSRSASLGPRPVSGAVVALLLAPTPGTRLVE